MFELDKNEVIKVLTRNAIKCLVCNTVLESKHRHHYNQCQCRNECAVDGGLDYQEKNHQKKELNKIIQDIKQRTQSLKDKRKNVKYKLDILYKHVEPTCKYGTNYLEYLDTLSEFDRMYIEGFNLVNEISDLTKEINRVGNAILYLRGDKWRLL